MERLVRQTHQYMTVQSIGEILPGKAGYKVISNLIKDVNYSKLCQALNPLLESLDPKIFMVSYNGIKEKH